MTTPDFEGRLIIVSNRLPVSIKSTGEASCDAKPSSGGLVTGLTGLAKSGVEYRWYGWPGMEIPRKHLSHVKDSLLQEHNAVPVPIDHKTAERYYDGFSNTTVWPLFHNQLHNVLFDDEAEAAYLRANELFADTIAPDLRDGDTVWVHDYHLMLLPLLLRQRAKKADINIRIGWFLHTPFPDEGTFSILPRKTEALNGILGADVVGFQTDEARRNFLNSCCQQVDRHSAHPRVLLKDREVSVGTFPIGIEPSEFHRRLQKECVQDRIRTMRDMFHGAKVIVGVDRLDHIKGVPQKLQAFDKFLERCPEWVGRAVLVQVLIPSRANLESSQDLLLDIQKRVGQINGKYGTINYVPIHFLYNSVSPDELTALYAMAEICFVSSTRDGMNLVSYEYIACHNTEAVQASRETITPGALVLSRFTGAAGVLGGALVVNPWDPTACAKGLAHASSMEVDEAHERMTEMGDKVEEQTRWVLNFLRALTGVQEKKKAIRVERADSMFDSSSDDNSI